MTFKLKFWVLCLMLFIFIPFDTLAQKESAVWYFGGNAGLDFNSGSPVALTNGQLVTKEGCATISNANGSLLFYTDGKTVWDSNHSVMPNGTGLLGDTSSTSSAIIIPKPGDASIYYIFTVDKPSYFLSEGDPISGVNYSKVDMDLNGGTGDIVPNEKNIHLITYDVTNAMQNEYKCSEKITAVTHSDGYSVWVITQFINKFFAFSVDENGVNPTPTISTVPQAIYPRIDEQGSNITAIGYLKVSPNGKKLAIAHSSVDLGGPRSGQKKSGKVLLYDFNNTNGIVSNQSTLVTGEYPYGVEFSPNSKLLYITSSIFDTEDDFVNSYLYQFNVEASDVANSKTIVNSSQTVAGALQLAIDGKIYRAGYPAFGSASSLSVINSPNTIGTACGYSPYNVSLNGNEVFLGLPPFITSIFRYSFNYEFTCLGDNTHFYVTSEDPYDNLTWDFGDGTTSTIEDAYHTYSSPGIYSVSLTLSLNGVDYDPIIKPVIISAPPDVLQTTYDLVNCDSFDNNPNDGISTFNLENAVGPISLNTTDRIDVFYYHTFQEAINDVDNENSLDYIYTNQIQDEILYAKVTKANTICYSIATVRLITSQSFEFGNFELTSCTLENSNQGEFNLNIARQNIITSLNLPTNVTIDFFESQQDAAIGVNPLENIYLSTIRTLFIRAEDNNACYGGGTLQLELVSFPVLEDQTITACQSDFPITIDSGLDVNIISDYNYLWSTSQTSEQIQIFQPGSYTLTVIDPINNCEDSLTITVIENALVEISSIELTDNSVVINLSNNGDDFIFALDDINGLYQDSNIFYGLTPGLHTVYVQDAYNCNTVEVSFNIIGFPDFFTPNNDGYNDHWNILGLEPTNFPNIQLLIFDRYGKLLKSFNPHLSNGWDGKYNGRLVTPDDYWYYLKLPNGKEYRGHFSLKI
ncbi:MAG TPA: T9SS type B sorting domain-containing protein [Mangrovimonas sp.]|nr:T9SS type B sorting domain-containing protein [Mangrovimonas sp.]